MKYTIDEIKKMQLFAGLINEVEYNESLWGVDKQPLNEAKKAKEVKKEVTIDTVNPYEYRHGLQHELNELGEYTDEALEKAKATVLKNLAKDVNFYSTLLNQKQSPYEFKKTETDKPGMQAKADGHLKKEAKKDEKANVKDNLGKKEEGSKKPKGVKVMPDKGVTGSEKTIKEGIEDKVEDAIKSGKIKPEEVKAAAEKAMKGDSSELAILMAGFKLAENNIEEGSLKESKYISTEEIDGETFPSLNKKAIAIYLKSVIDPSELKSVDAFMRDEEGFDESASYFFDTPDAPEEEDGVNIPDSQVEDWAKQEMSYYLFSSPDEFPGKENIEEEFRPGVDLGASFSKFKGMTDAEDQFEDLMRDYDWYYEMSDDPRSYDYGTETDQKIKSLAKTIGVDRAVELYNQYAPSDRKITTSFFAEGKENKHAKLKEALKSALKKEIINPKDIQAAKSTGDVVNIPAQDTAAQTAARNAKINFRTYKA